MMKTSTAPTPASGSPIEDNWLAWLDNPSETDLKMLAEWEARDKRVGALLRVLHYSVTSKPPPDWWPSHKTEEQYWTDYARSAPGLSEAKLKVAVNRLRAEPYSANNPKT